MLQGTTTTPSPFVPPTREELKVAFGSTNDTFDVVYTTTPPLTAQPPGTYLQKHEYKGQRVNLVWTRPGWLLLVVLVPLAIKELTGYPPDATFLLSDSDHMPVPSIEKPLQEPTYVATTPAPVSPSRIQSIQEWDGFPIGSTLRLVSLNEENRSHA